MDKPGSVGRLTDLSGKTLLVPAPDLASEWAASSSPDLELARDSSSLAQAETTLARREARPGVEVGGPYPAVYLIWKQRELSFGPNPDGPAELALSGRS